MPVVLIFVCRVTIVKDKDSRRSKGIAFILYLQPDEAWTAVRAVNDTTVSYLPLHTDDPRDIVRCC